MVECVSFRHAHANSLQSYEEVRKEPKENSFFFVLSSESTFSLSEKLVQNFDLAKGMRIYFIPEREKVD